MQPPVVDGLTSRTRGDLLSLLAGRESGNGPRPGAIDLREGMAALRRAAESDPKLEHRVAQALDILMGTDGESDPGADGDDPKVGPMAGGNIQTPV